MSILHSKRSGMYIYEQTKIMMKDEKVTFIETKKATQNFISIPIKNTQFIVLTSGCSITSAAVKRLAKCAVNPRPIGRGYKALKNNVFY
jgi:CRISPR-associated protein Cas1